MNFLKVKVEVDAEQLAQRERIITGNNSGKVKGKCLKRRFVQNKNIDESEKQCDLYNIEDELTNLCDEYNNELKSSAYFEIIEAKEKKLSIYSMIKENLSFDSLFNNLFHKLDLKSCNIEIEEVTFREFEDKVNFHSKSDLFKTFGIDSLRCRNDDYIEKIIDCSTNAFLLNDEDNFIGRENLFNELKRIYSSSVKNKFYGHPVHYLIDTDDFEDSQESCETLIKALYQKKRISSKRFCVVKFEDEIREDFIESLYRIGNGGAIIIDTASYRADEDKGHFKRGNYLKLAGLCRLINKYKNNVLTIFCFPLNNKEVKKDFLSYLDKLFLVDLSENVVSYSKACDYLKLLAKNNKTRFKKTLSESLKTADGPLTPKSLNELFAAWYEYDLRHSVFPQYKDVKTINYSKENNSNKSALKELNDLIGLTKAKQLINRIISYNKLQKIIRKRGCEASCNAMHMVFSGNPGSAKTTVARLFAKIMKEEGVLSTGVFVEVGRGDLIGKYVGHTAPLVRSQFERAKGGVLFIDEAYSLLDDRKGCFADEAINTIVQEMENKRDDVIVIFAGYKDEMKSFVERNPGLHSRIAHQVEFEDYSSDELCEIAEYIAEKSNYSFSNDALKKLSIIFDKARNTLNFGNGRYARNIFEKAKLVQSERLASHSFDSLSDDDLFTLTADDIELPDSISYDKKHIGFAIA